MNKKLFELDNVRRACRPDYRLYPDTAETREKRSNHIRLFDAQSKLLPITQDVENAFTNKYNIVDDNNMWSAADEDLLAALKRLSNYKQLSFAQPIWMPKLLNNKQLQEAFFQLHLTSGSKLTWKPIPLARVQESFAFVKRCKEVWPRTTIGSLYINFPVPYQDRQKQWELFQKLCQTLTYAKQNKISMVIEQLNNYQIINQKSASPIRFQELSWFSESRPKQCWLDYLVQRYFLVNKVDTYSGDFIQTCLAQPSTWPAEFRDLLRQTYQMKDFCLTRWGDARLSEDVIPWPILEKEFKYGL